jgi:hypothetical protein
VRGGWGFDVFVFRRKGPGLILEKQSSFLKTFLFRPCQTVLHGTSMIEERRGSKVAENGAGSGHAELQASERFI